MGLDRQELGVLGPVEFLKTGQPVADFPSPLLLVLIMPLVVPANIHFGVTAGLINQPTPLRHRLNLTR